MGPFGSNITTDNFVPSGVPVIRGKNLLENEFQESGFVYLTPEKAEDLKSAKAIPGDLVFTHRGTLGQVALIPTDSKFSEYIISQSQIRARFDTSKVDPRFMHYWFCSSPGQKALLRNTSQTGVPAIAQPTSSIRSIAVPLPPLPEQRRIADVLGTLDELVSVNSKIVQEISLLRGGFVSGALASAKDESPLSKMASFINGKNFTKNASGTGRPVIRTPEIRRGPTDNTVWSDLEVEDDYLARVGDILFVWSGSLMVDRWMFQEGLVNQHIFKVIPNFGVPAWLVKGLLDHQMSWFIGLALDKATTMGHIQRMHLDALVPVPTELEIIKLDSIVRPLWDFELQLLLENQQLKRTRNELLPLLLSGAITVRDVAA